jgi:hypothetical protein
MSFKLKALVASLALVAAFPASAAIATASSGNSSFVLSLIDEASGKSATFDLGVNYNTFALGSNQTFNVSTGDYAAAWTEFWANSSAATTEYAVYASKNIGTFAGSRAIITTAGTQDGMSLVDNSTLSDQIGLFDTYLGFNNAISSHNNPLVPNGGSYGVDGDEWFAGNSYAYSAGSIAGYGNDATGAIGSDLNLWNVVRGTGGNGGDAVVTQLGTSYFNLSSAGVLSYVAAAPEAVAAVPEADTSAMMLAGLGLMGFIARRRKSV